MKKFVNWLKSLLEDLFRDKRYTKEEWALVEALGFEFTPVRELLGNLRSVQIVGNLEGPKEYMERLRITKNFSLYEWLRYNDGKRVNMHPDVKQVLNIHRQALHMQWWRNFFGVPFKVTSGLRSKHWNRSVRGAKFSRHLYGDATDGVWLCDKYGIDFFRDNFIENHELCPIRARIEMKVGWWHTQWKPEECKRDIKIWPKHTRSATKP